MLLLAVDTSGRNGSLALARATTGHNKIETLEVVPLAGGAFSAQLVPQIASLLQRHSYTKADLGGFAAATGPGSFTGLRVGLAAIKGLAEALEKPIAAVSALEAVAHSSATAGRIIAALDAGRSDVYVGDYEAGTLLRMHSERLMSREEFLAEVQGKTVVTPDIGLSDALTTAGMSCELVKHPNAAVIALLGWQRLDRGETVSPENLEANYLRHSDAEIFSKPPR